MHRISEFLAYSAVIFTSALLVLVVVHVIMTLAMALASVVPVAWQLPVAILVVLLPVSLALGALVTWG